MAAAAEASAAYQTQAATNPPAAAATESGAYDVAGAAARGMAMAAWFKPARDRISAMTEAQRPAADFDRFREVNKAALIRLQDELSGWSKSAQRGDCQGACGAPT